MSDLSYAGSLKSFTLMLIAGEIGFIGGNPISEVATYEDFVSFFEGMKSKVKSKEMSDENCNFYYKDSSKSFEVDFEKDLRFSLDIIKMINILINNIGAVDDIAVNLSVNTIYEKIGLIINNEDEYFEVLEALWETMVKDKESYGSRYEEVKLDKIKRLRHSFLLSDDRIDKLKLL
jgi:hypothetical protein